MSNFMVIRQMGTELFHVGGQADRRTHRWTDRRTDGHSEDNGLDVLLTARLSTILVTDQQNAQILVL